MEDRLARGVRRRRRAPEIDQRVASAVGEGAVTIPYVHRYLEGLAMPETVAR
jgi:hypothetical protein